MVTAILTGVFGVIGSALGAVIAWASRRDADNRAFRLADLDREHAWLDQQRAACADLLTAVDNFYEAARDLWWRMDEPGAAEHPGPEYVAYGTAWRAMVGSLSSFRLVAPADLGEEAAMLRTRAGEYCDELDARHAGRSWKPATLEARRHALHDARLQFLENARRSLSPERDLGEAARPVPGSTGPREAEAA